MPKHVTETTTASISAVHTLVSPVINTGISGTAVLDEDTMTSDSATKVATQQSIKAYVVTSVAAVNLNPWLFMRPKFTYNGGATAYTVKVGAGAYYVKDKVAKWTTELTTTAVGTPVASTRYYLYLDYSAITSWTNITATELIWSSTAPTYSHTYGGWYNSDDRCIFGVITNSGPTNVAEFFHDGGESCFWADSVAEATDITPTTTWTDVDMASSVPAFATKAVVTMSAEYVDTATYALIRTNGQTGTAGHYCLPVNNASVYNSTQLVVHTDASQVVEVCFGGATAGNKMKLYCDGWCFPGGM